MTRTGIGRWVLVAGGLVLLTPAALAQDVAPGGEPPAAPGAEPPGEPSQPPADLSPGKAKLEELADKVRNASSISYRVRFHAEGGLFAMGSAGVSQEILMVRDPASPPKWLVKYSGMGNVPSQGDFPINVVFRNDKYEFADEKSKQVVARPQRSARNKQVDVALLGSLRGLAEAAPLAKDLAAEAVTLEEPKDVAGAMCDVVHVDPGGTQQKLRWYLAQSDGLPRKLEVIYVGPKGGNDTSGLQIFDITGFALNEALMPEQFTLTIPEGYSDLRAPAVVPNTAPATPNVRDGHSGDGQTPRPTPTPAGPTIRPVGTSVGQIAPDFELPASDGAKFHLKDYRGKVVVLDFGGAWLQTSRATGGPMKQLVEKFKDQPVQVVGLSARDRAPEAAGELWKQESRPYPLVPAADAVAKLYQVRAFPTIYVISFQGEVLMQHAGFDAKTGDPFPAITKLIEAYLKDPKAPAPVLTAPTPAAAEAPARPSGNGEDGAEPMGEGLEAGGG